MRLRRYTLAKQPFWPVRASQALSLTASGDIILRDRDIPIDSKNDYLILCAARVTWWGKLWIGVRYV